MQVYNQTFNFIHTPTYVYTLWTLQSQFQLFRGVLCLAGHHRRIHQQRLEHSHTHSPTNISRNPVMHASLISSIIHTFPTKYQA